MPECRGHGSLREVGDAQLHVQAVRTECDILCRREAPRPNTLFVQPIQMRRLSILSNDSPRGFPAIAVQHELIRGIIGRQIDLASLPQEAAVFDAIAEGHQRETGHFQSVSSVDDRGPQDRQCHVRLQVPESADRSANVGTQASDQPPATQLNLCRYEWGKVNAHVFGTVRTSSVAGRSTDTCNDNLVFCVPYLREKNLEVSPMRAQHVSADKKAQPYTATVRPHDVMHWPRSAVPAAMAATTLRGRHDANRQLRWAMPDRRHPRLGFSCQFETLDLLDDGTE